VLKRERGGRPGLRGDIGELRAGAGVEIVDAGSELRASVFERTEDLDNGGAGVVLGDDERVRERRSAVAGPRWWKEWGDPGSGKKGSPPGTAPSGPQTVFFFKKKRGK